MLVTDLYELTMAAVYRRRGMAAAATFGLFARKLPAGRGFLVAAGLDEAVDRLLAWQVTDADTRWLGEQLGTGEATFAPLAGLRFTGDAWAVPEGAVVLADEPLLEVTAPLPEAQVPESMLLNAVTYQTALASKAVRCVLAARGRPVVDFSLRRDHGIEAAAAAARAGALAGFAATSNVAAAHELGVPATGTMAHSYVQAVGDERAAFAAFAAAFPASPTFLVDTFDTAGGVRAAAAVIRERGLGDRAAVRLDSGDLAAEARLARRLLDDAGLPAVRIVVSGGLDELAVDDLAAAGAPVDVFAVGTRVGTSADAPSLDSAYKLVEYDARPITKLSAGKGYPPGPKQVWRRPGAADLVTTRDDEGPPGARALLEPVVRDGRRLRPAATLAQARARLEQDLAWLPDDAKRVRDPAPAACVTSDRLRRLHEEVRAGLRAASAPPSG
ncbi:nicotinate phosphoribosyltransferase [Georgenia thermotolerans]|uniref:Nicotinate phosphoribosyltransferase n=1 Tax=Georgenia thermotolerans TaxID=527326 RepID=A0A7J5UP13_9MICO|nr:nicotinate phosphoribosyltransferase [Georgenia thermotolerans]KAE8764109.1 nicotinate phosphoribosyltransferase [Georgenia thermotolerans]